MSGSPRRIGVEEVQERLDLTPQQLAALIATGRIPRPVEYRVPGRPTFTYFERPALERALARIVQQAEKTAA